ncbi:MAG: hypothetical protein ACREOK_06130 [Gemmatimonadaceae bacterium]
MKLHVVRARVAQRHAAGERSGLDVEREQRGITKLAERPLVWIRDEADALRTKHAPRIRGSRELDGRRLVRDQQSRGLQLVQHAAREHEFE